MSGLSVEQEGLITYLPGLQPPIGYVCKLCESPRHGIKLWKNRSPLERKAICVNCMERVLSSPMPEVSPEGLIKREDRMTLSPVIRCFVPAVPITVPVSNFWPYPQLPNGALEWWMSLPLR